MITQQERTSSPPAREAEQQAEELLSEFDQWATSADSRDAGWESDFPQWRELMAQAEQLMAQKHPSEQALFLLGRCWALSNEAETCAYWAREQIQNSHVQEWVRRLTGSTEQDARWQAYDVLGDLPALNQKTQDILNAGTRDTVPYVRRRAFLALLRYPETDAESYIGQMLADADSYNRYVAVKEGMRLNSEALQYQIQAALQDPAVTELYNYYLDHKELIDRSEKR